MKKNESVEIINKMLSHGKVEISVLEDCLSKEESIEVIPLRISKCECIVRVRVNDEKELFDNISKLSYPPASKSKLLRASLPNHSMFYGSLRAKTIENEIIYPRIAALCEASDKLRDFKFSGYQVVTYGIWRVVQDVPIFSFPVSNNYSNYTFDSNRIRDYWMKEMTSNNIKHESALFSEFIGDLMAEEGSNSVYEVTARTIQFILKHNNALCKYKGVAYPSHQYDGKATNVALYPDAIDNYCKFEAAYVGGFIKFNGEIYLKEYAFAEWNNKGDIKWKYLETKPFCTGSAEV